MTHYIAFLKKEIVESVRTYKLFIMLVVYLIFGVMNPLVAKLTPYIVESLMPEGVSILVPEPSALDSWAQFFKNIIQMGLIVMIVVFNGILTAEVSKGTLINMLTKGLSRKAVILSKFTCMALIWTTSLILSFIVTWGYTVYLFPGDGGNYLFFSVFCLWLFGLFLLSLLIFSSAFIKSNYGSLLIVGVAVVVCILLNLIPNFKQYNPLLLTSKNMELLANTAIPSTLYHAVGITAIMTTILIALAILIFRKKQL